MSTFRRRMMMKAKEQQSSVGEWDYFTIVAGENPVNMEIVPYMFYNESDGTDGYLETSYSIDGGEWVNFSDKLSLTIPAQSRVRFCSNVQNYEMIEVPCQFVSVDNFSIDGTVMSLMYGHEFNGEYEIPANIISGVLVFFDQESPGYNSSGLTRISNLETLLPATTLTSYCYASMFRYCTLLSVAPKLPATTLAENCYKEMFRGCTSLVNAPELPATTLFDYCYESMFTDCTNLNYIKMLATNISALNCLNSWVYRVALTGTFVKSKDATWDVTGVNGVPTGWTVITDDQESEGSEWTYEKHYVFVLVEDIDGFYAVLEDTIDVCNLTLTMLNSIGLEGGEDLWYSLYIDAVPDEFNITFNGEKINYIVLSRDGYIEFETNSYYIDMDINIAMVYGK